MRNAIHSGNRFGKLAFVVVLAVGALSLLTGMAQAASPAWKVLAVSGPSNLPPLQSEVQRVTVEADGGTFALGYPGLKGEGTPVHVEAELAVTEGSTEAIIENVTGSGAIEPGDRVTVPGYYESTTIVSCSVGDCRTAGSTMELSEPAGATETGAVREIYTRELSDVTGSFAVGEEISQTFFLGEGYEYFPRGTVVTGVGSGTLTLSSPTFGYDASEGPIELATAARLAFDASSGEVQSALEAKLGPGSVVVAGGPGGSAEHPYLVEFAGADGSGPYADQDVASLFVDSSGLEGDAPGVHAFTIVPGGPGSGEIVAYPTDIGGSKTSAPYSLRIGPLPSSVQATGPATGEGWKCQESVAGDVITCTSSTGVQPLSPALPVRLPVRVEAAVPETSSVGVEISGGGAEPAEFQVPIVISSTPAPFATRAFWAGAFDADGALETQAGAHPFSAQTDFVLNTVRSGKGEVIPAGVLKQVEADLPAGFSGNPLATGRCPQDQLVAIEEGFAACNKAGMGIGNFLPMTDGLAIPFAHPFPIFNDVPARGAAAEFSTNISTPIQSLLGSVRSEEDFGVTVTAPNVANFFKLFGSYVALEGQPPAADGRAFLNNPTDCAAESVDQPLANLRLEAYELPGVIDRESVPLPAVTGCDQLKFAPSFDLLPTTTQGSAPTGATADLRIPQEGLTDPSELASPDLKKAVVTLPEGLTVNPSSANGLQACSEAQVGYQGGKSNPLNPTVFDEAPVTCPDASKLGTVDIKTPLLDEEEGKLEGTIYLAAQEENPFHSLLGLYLVVENERFGITLKLPGEVRPDPGTGRLTATFDDNPQLPFEELTLNIRGGGPRATLATTEVCGTYKTTGSLEPWSAPESGPPTQIEEPGFTVSGGCSSSSSARPFGPTFEAGTTGTQAGAYSPLVVKVSRKDGEQELKSLDFTLPKGLIGKLAGIPYCSEASIREAEGKSGKAEQASSSCPAGSQIGTVDTAAGVGSEPIHVGGKVYLAGPYKGAPLSSVVVTPAVAGPFDLGDVVIRAPLYVDPETAEITAKSDPIPTILKGIPLKVRSVAIDLDRPGFTLNPTSCNLMEATASIGGSSGATAKPASRFQVGGCKSLKFKPRLKLSLKGSTKHAGHPALKAVLTYPKQGTYANIRRAQVNLPHSEFIDQANLDKTCTKPVLLEGKCPKRSIYGYAKAWTPLLEKPLEGPVYLVGGYGYKLPALVAELNGQIRVVLKGKVDSGPNRGIRNTFEAVPDAPVSRFMLQLKGGQKYSLLENSEDLCRKPQRALARFTGQNGAVEQVKPLIANQCDRGKKKSSNRGKAKKH